MKKIDTVDFMHLHACTLADLLAVLVVVSVVAGRGGAWWP